MSLTQEYIFVAEEFPCLRRDDILDEKSREFLDEECPEERLDSQYKTYFRITESPFQLSSYYSICAFCNGLWGSFLLLSLGVVENPWMYLVKEARRKMSYVFYESVHTVQGGNNDAICTIACDLLIRSMSW